MSISEFGHSITSIALRVRTSDMKIIKNTIQKIIYALIWIYESGQQQDLL